MSKHEFTINKTVLKDGTELFIPLVRPFKRFIKPPWSRICLIYGKYILQDLDFETNLTHNDCEQHIEGYKQHLICLEAKKIKHVQIEQPTKISF